MKLPRSQFRFKYETSSVALTQLVWPLVQYLLVPGHVTQLHGPCVSAEGSSDERCDCRQRILVISQRLFQQSDDGGSVQHEVLEWRTGLGQPALHLTVAQQRVLVQQGTHGFRS